jgi:transposase
VKAERPASMTEPLSKKVGLSLTEHDELRRLRKENEQLRMEREILKKAAVFFAKEVE